MHRDSKRFCIPSYKKVEPCIFDFAALVEKNDRLSKNDK